MHAIHRTRLFAVLLALSSSARADRCTSRLDKTGAQHGPSRCVGEGGQLVYEATYEKGKLQGERRTYYPGGQLRERQIYRDDHLEGTCAAFYESGRPRQSTAYRDGLRDGEDVRYLEGGGVSERDLYQDGQLLSRRSYYPNGKPRTEDLYGEGSAVRREFYPNGVLRYEAPCLLGRGRTVHGLARHYREDGQLARETRYEHGVRSGPDREFHRNGRLAVERIYRGDQIVRTRAYDEQGRALSETTSRSERTRVTTR